MFERWSRSMQETPVTWILSILHAMVYLYIASVDPTFSTETLMGLGAHSNPAVWKGEWYRLLTCGVLHGGALHFLMNNFALIMLGRLLEHLLGSAGFLWLYLLSLLAGNLASLVFMSPMAVSIGASGAIMGLAGTLFVLLLLDREERFLEAQSFGKYVFFGLILFQLFIGGLIPFINNSAHLGGFAVGLCFGTFFWSRIPGVRLPRVVGSVVMGACLVGVLALGIRGMQPKNTFSWHVYNGLQAFQDKNTKLSVQNALIVEKELKAALQSKPKSKEAHWYLGELYIQRKMYKKAALIFGALVQQEPQHFAYWLNWIAALAKSGQHTVAERAFLQANDRFVLGKGRKGWLASFSPVARMDKDLLKARLCVAMLRDRQAILLYLRLLDREPNNITYHNDFAWLLVTAHDRRFRNPKRALDYAHYATQRSPNAAFLDTLASAYFANGKIKKALQVEKKARFQSGAKWTMPHLHMQIQRFEQALKKRAKLKKAKQRTPKRKATQRTVPTTRPVRK